MDKRYKRCACGLLAAVLALVPNGAYGFFEVMALPFAALGGLLRMLSLSGPVGNAVSIGLYALVCCIPLAAWWRSRRQPEDWLLVLLAGILALVLYYMVNPNLRQSAWQNEMGDAVYTLPIWSALVAWGVLKLVGSAQTLERNIYRCLRSFLLLCAVVCLMDSFGTELRSLLWYLDYYGKMDFSYGFGIGPTLAFLCLRYLVLAAEGILTALVLYKGVALLDELEEAPFSEACVAAAEAVSRWCRRSLSVIALSSLLMNFAQLLMHDMLLNVQMELSLPLLGLAVCFAMLAVTKLLVRGKELKDDNDLFV